MIEEFIRSTQYFIVLQSLLFSGYLLLNNRLTELPNRFLSMLLIVLGCHMGINLLGASVSHKGITAVTNSLGFCYGPIVLLYSRSLSNKEQSFRVRDLWHLLPALLTFIVTVFTTLTHLIFALGVLLSLSVYSVMTYLTIRRYHYVLSQTKSYFELVKLTWLIRLLALQCSILILNILSVSLMTSGREEIGKVVELGVFVGLLGMVSLFVFHGLQHPKFFDGVTSEDRCIAQGKPAAKDPVKAELMEKIEAHMQETKAYLRPGLTIKTLGRQILTNPVLVSQAINSQTGRNFSDYVNRLRILDACAMLDAADHAEQSILEIMLSSGFLTKSNFNRVFKKETGFTPLAYRKRAQSSDAG